MATETASSELFAGSRPTSSIPPLPSTSHLKNMRFLCSKDAHTYPTLHVGITLSRADIWSNILHSEQLQCKLLPTSHIRRVKSKQIKRCNPVRNERCWIENVLTLLPAAISENSCHRLVWQDWVRGEKYLWATRQLTSAIKVTLTSLTTNSATHFCTKRNSINWCVDTSMVWDVFVYVYRSETPGKFRNVVLEKDGEDQLDLSCEKLGSITLS